MSARSLPPELRPTPHPYEPQPGTDECSECSMPFAGYHTSDVRDAQVPDVHDEIPTCPECTHYLHDKGPCRVLVQRQPVLVCDCRKAAA